jgi:hypothetical protein
MAVIHPVSLRKERLTMPLNAQLLAQLHQNDTGVKSLDLSKQALTKEDIIQLVKALSTNTSLISLDVSDNRIGAEGAKALSTNTSLTSLDVSYNRIGAEGAKALSTNTSLISLKVRGNQIGTEGAKALSTNTTLTSLKVTGNQIGDEGAKALSTNTTLTLLDVAYNQIGDEGAKALSTNTRLTSLDLCDNEIGDEGAKALSTNSRLTSLDISYNQIGDKGAKALSTNTRLTSLDVSHNLIEWNYEQQLVANKERRRNGFILTLGKGLSKAQALAGTPSLPLPAELISHIGTFLDTGFYLQLADIENPICIGKTEQQVYHCVLLLLQQLAAKQVTQGHIIEQRPNTPKALDYRQHFLFRPVVQAEVVEPPAKKQKREPESLCAIL